MPVNQKLLTDTLRNVRELISEAGLLIKNSKFARGYTLIQVATEETAKALMLMAAAVAESGDIPIDAKKLKRALQNHKFKIAVANWFDDVMTCAPDGTDQDRAWRELLVQHKLFNKLKNDSLYVGVDAEPSVPAELFHNEGGQKMVRAWLSICQARFKAAEEIITDSLQKIENGTVNQRDPELESNDHVSFRHALTAYVVTLLNLPKE